MNEPATGDIPPDAMRFGDGRHSHERYHNQYALLMAMATTAGLLARHAGPADLRPVAGPVPPASSATPPTGWATTSPGGTTCG